MYHTILVPVDGSRRAEAILLHVEKLARHDRAKVIFLQVEEAPMLLGYDEVIDFDAYRNERKRRKAQVEFYLSNLQDKFLKKGIEAHFNIVYGPVVESILKAAEEEKADLVAIASRGLNGSYQAVFRSVAVGLLQRTDRPLMLIRSNTDD